MNLRSAITALFENESTQDQRGTGRSALALRQIAYLCKHSVRESYVFLSHDQQACQMHQRMFLAICRGPKFIVEPSVRPESYVVSGSCRVHFRTDYDAIWRRGRDIDGVFEDHFRFEQRLARFLEVDTLT